MKRIASILLLFLGISYQINACITFVLKKDNSVVFSWNYEFDAGSGYLITNKRDLLKTSFVPKGEMPIKWISKYGSMTFNQWGKEFPSGGVNEKGLVVVQTMFTNTKYPERDLRPAISELQWIQYQLDNYTTVQEVIDSNQSLRISNNSIPLHYMICDKSGNVAVIEFINGEMIFYKNDQLLYPVLGNDSYSESLTELKKYRGFGGILELPQKSTGPKSGNFIIASDFVRNFTTKENIIDYSFKALAKSSEERRTQWSVVFELNDGMLYFKTLDNKKIKKITVGSFDFACNSTIKILDLSSDDSNNFISYKPVIDEDYINKAYNNPAISWIKEIISEDSNNEKIKYIRTIKCK